MTRSAASVASTASASNAGSSTYVQPTYSAGISVTNAPLNASEPECMTTLSGWIRNELAKPVAYASRIRCVCTIPFGSPVVPELYRIVSGWSSGSRGAGGGDGEAASVSAS